MGSFICKALGISHIFVKMRLYFLTIHSVKYFLNLFYIKMSDSQYYTT
ncbi:hypothetical protein M23134_01335 [Microscilla marina ATCC 23134]|uniref:Uncharacterized protein n=1 Tax=Microscilla marina ATCC 23134 TaxID=313606 RepID=A1ZJH8_MICM2|nr:hypothetical protein M23134_01335 [Microscilla marina ATCC 23134]